MRKEIESIVSREGWSKSSLDKMHKLDSFIKESLRMSGMPSGTYSSASKYMHPNLSP